MRIQFLCIRPTKSWAALCTSFVRFGEVFLFWKKFEAKTKLKKRLYCYTNSYTNRHVTWYMLIYDCFTFLNTVFKWILQIIKRLDQIYIFIEEQYAIRCKCISLSHTHKHKRHYVHPNTQNAEQKRWTMKRICRDRESSFMHIAPKIENLLWQWIYRFSLVVDYFDDAFIPFWLPFIATIFVRFFHIVSFVLVVCVHFLFFFYLPSLISYPLFCLGAWWSVHRCNSNQNIYIHSTENRSTIHNVWMCGHKA